MTENKTKPALIDGSRLITEACVRAGASVFVGYPITPANLLYSYANRRYPVMMAAPDEITTLQWMAGYATLGKIPVTATSFPGYALMIESINMAQMMELPMVIILVQRLGPATGTATAGAQGDLNVVHGTISGGFQLPTFCISNFDDCWHLSAKAVQTAAKLRTPVILLTSKEMVMTHMRYDLSRLGTIEEAVIHDFEGDNFLSYQVNGSYVPNFLPLSQNKHQVRFTASTHNKAGILQNTTPEALENTRRLKTKVDLGTELIYDYDEQLEAETLVIAFDLTAQAARESVLRLREKSKPVSLLVPKTLFPISEHYKHIASNYKKVVVAEENLDGQYRRLLFGPFHEGHIKGVNAMGRMIKPEEIMEAVENNG
jgi:2-oxoglutarate ferredoxin oxidoreductase subunit alpha